MSSENCIEYFIFVLDEKIDGQNTQLRLASLKAEAISLAQKLAGDYIWQRQGLQLSFEHDEGKSCIWSTRSSIAR